MGSVWGPKERTPGPGFSDVWPGPLFMGDDGFVGVGYQHPLTGAQFFGWPYIPARGGTTLLHGARIHGVPKYPVDGEADIVGLSLLLLYNSRWEHALLWNVKF